VFFCVTGDIKKNNCRSSETMPDKKIEKKMLLLQQKWKEKTKEGLLLRLQKFEDKGFNLVKYFTMVSEREEMLHELARLHVLEKKIVTGNIEETRKCIAWGCGNFLAPDEDLRCKICDY